MSDSIVYETMPQNNFEIVEDVVSTFTVLPSSISRQAPEHLQCIFSAATNPKRQRIDIGAQLLDEKERLLIEKFKIKKRKISC